jgi:queuine tRNA-ribosyltransferase
VSDRAADALEGSCEVVTLRNGLRAIRHHESGEVMHCGAGPAVESQELYVAPSRLEARLEEGGAPLVLLDVGLGAASNALAAWRLSESLPNSARRLEVVSFDHDLDALRLALLPENAGAFGLEEPAARAAATALLAHGHHETARTSWRLAFGDFLVALAAEPDASADIVYWDMFSRGKNPALWTVAAFGALRRVCRAGATLHTYSAATSTRSGLLLGGFAVGVGERTGDKEQTTIAAVSADDLAHPLDARWLTRLARSSAAFPIDVATDAAGREEALARIRAHAQFKPRAARA